ncbi:MAG: hypothetical protein LBT21_07120 [Oscillospiraceae bacterium]|jgi:hypothetical protein|nr:hypothetical protein [Oscillospiraceae bacterium]
MNASEFLESIKTALQQYVVDGGFVPPEFNWLKDLIATIFDWFAKQFA